MGNTNLAYRFDVVMLIDDDETDNYINNRVIAASHFSKTVITMTTAESALKYLIKNSQAGTDAEPLPQIIFLDLNMGGMNGVEFLKEFEKLNDAVRALCKIVVLSNFIHMNDPKGLESNPHVTNFLEKPLTSQKLEVVKEKN